MASPLSVKSKSVEVEETANDYSSSTDVPLGAVGGFRALIKNTGADSIKYKVVGHATPGGTLSVDVVAEATLAAAAEADLKVKGSDAYPLASLTIRCKSAAEDTPGALLVEYAAEAPRLILI